MKIKSLVTFPIPTGEGVLKDKIYDVVDIGLFDEWVGVMSEDKSCLTYLRANYNGTQEFEIIEEW